MTQKKDSQSEDMLAVHQYYMGILNSMPNIVYWVDVNGNLKGCNKHFVALLGLQYLNDLSGTPYEQMSRFTSWPKARIDAFRLDDMVVLFSGEAKYNVEEAPVFDKNEETTYYLATRVPLYDKDKHVNGLVVILTDITERKNAEHLLTMAKPNGHAINRDSGSPFNVLMVEDNIVAQQVEGALLTSLNCQVDIAESGDKAMRLFDPGKYDIVLMDIELQDTSGYMIAKKIRQLEQNTTYHVPIIALTTYQADVVKYDCSDYSMDGVLTKPLTTEQAKQIIQHYIYHEDIPISGLKSAQGK